MKLEKFNYSDGKGKRMFLYGFIMCAVLMILINLFFSQAKYLNTESVKIAEGTISYKPYDFKIMAMYQENENNEYEEIETMPTSGYVINEEKSYCTLDNINKDTSAILKTIDGNHTFSNLSKNEKCYIYFDKKPIAIQEILATKTISTRTDFSTTLTADTTGTIYSAEDDDGPSYYFAGAPTDNWVKFAGFYWRIIRINGDGTLRLIYSGSEESGPVTTGDATQIGKSAFNTNHEDNMYCGFMYTSGEVHGLSKSSTIKEELDNWYENNLENYSNIIDKNTGFCNDRIPYSGTGIGQTSTTYKTYYRLINYKPSLKCGNNNDLFTLINSNKGNKSLKNPIGLITSDEIAYAGGVLNETNSSFYLHTEKYYWSMSPYYIETYTDNDNVTKWYIREFGVGEVNSIEYATVDNLVGVRPVINLRADVILTGDGTSANPYTVK